eukprot:scaffold10850_cov41-Prasinocladus_malaysianus.AAC.1
MTAACSCGASPRRRSTARSQVTQTSPSRQRRCAPSPAKGKPATSEGAAIDTEQQMKAAQDAETGDTEMKDVEMVCRSVQLGFADCVRQSNKVFDTVSRPQ